MAGNLFSLSRHSGLSRISQIITLILFYFLLSTTPSLANIKTLNGQDGQDQTFQNDSNILINSLNNVHALQWAGLLPVSRGGTGASSFTDGSIPFIDAGVFGEDSDNLYWDNVNKRLGIGTNQPEARIHVSGGQVLLNNDLIMHNLSGGAGQNIQFKDSNDFTTVQIAYEPLEEGDFGSLVLSTSGLGSGGIGISSRNGNTVVSRSPASYPEPEALFQILDDASRPSTLMIGGTDPLTGDNQDSIGCLAMVDTDKDGITWITANDGVLTASTTKPSICQ